MCTRSVESKCAALLAALAVLGMADSAGAQGYPAKFDFGVPASAEDISKVAIAIRPDGEGLPAGKGDYATGKKVYETSCTACHGEDLQGVAGLPNMPSGQALRLIGGRGTLATKNPVMTVESYWPYATTLFDYVRRAMPFQAPGSLTADEVYSVSAYIWPRPMSSTKQRRSTRTRFRACRCQIARVSFQTRDRSYSNSDLSSVPNTPRSTVNS